MVLTAAAFSSPFLVFGEKTDELKTEISEKNKQIQELEEEIARFQSEIEKTGKDADSLKKQISVINSTISKLSKDISVAQKKIEAAELNLQKLGIEISAQESNIDELGGGLAELVRGLYELESQSLIEVLLAKSSISDFFQDLDYMQDLSSKMKIKLAEFKEAKEQLESEKTAEESVKKELVGLGLELKERRNIEQGAKGQKDIILKETKNKETEYQRILKEREAQREAVLNEIQEIEDELRKLIDPNAIPSARQGVLSWPVKGAVLTQSFGSTPESGQSQNVAVRQRIRAKRGERIGEAGLVLECRERFFTRHELDSGAVSCFLQNTANPWRQRSRFVARRVQGQEYADFRLDRQLIG